MRLLTTILELAIHCLYKDVIRLMTKSQWTKLYPTACSQYSFPIMIFMNLIELITVQARLDKGLGLKSTSGTQAIVPIFRPS